MKNIEKETKHNLFCNYLEHLGVVERYMKKNYSFDVNNCDKRQWNVYKDIYQRELNEFKQNYENSYSFDELNEKWKDIIIELEREEGLDGKNRELSIF